MSTNYRELGRQTIQAGFPEIGRRTLALAEEGERVGMPERFEGFQVFPRPPRYHHPSFTFDPFHMEISFEGRLRLLSPTEMRVLYMFCLQPNTLIMQEELCNAVWRDDTKSTRILDVNVTRLRKKLTQLRSGQNGLEIISTVRGKGYILHDSSRVDES